MEDFGPIGTEEIVNKKSKKTLFIIFPILVVVCAVLGVLMWQMTKPRFVFDKTINMITSFEEAEEFDTIKVSGDLKFSVTGDEESRILSDAVIAYNVELDKPNKQELVALKLTSAEDELINGKLKLDASAKKIYLDLGEFFDKPIEFSAADLSSEDYDVFETTELTFGQKINGTVASKILRKEIKAQFKDEYFSAEKVTVDGENLTKNTLRMTGEQFNTIVENACGNLSVNEEFLECFEDGQKVKNSLSDLVTSVKDIELEEFKNIEISCYTAGLKNEVKKVDMVFDDDIEKISVQVKVESPEEFSYKAFIDEKEAFSGKAKIVLDNENYLIEISSAQDGVETAIKVSGNVVYDEPITEFDVSNAVKAEELTDEDGMVLYNNFLNSKLYEIIAEWFSNYMIGFDDIDSSNNTDNVDYIDGGWSQSNDLDKVDDSYDANLGWGNFNNFHEENNNEETIVSRELNVLQTYNDQIIKFNIPEGYECYSSESDAFKLFEKEIGDDNLNVDVSIEYDTMDEYIQDIKENVQVGQNDWGHVNVNLTEDEIEVNGIRFRRMIHTYDTELLSDMTISHVNVYVAHEVDSENLYVVEVSGPEMISDQELGQFLLIEK